MACEADALSAALRPIAERVNVAGIRGYSKARLDKLGSALTRILDEDRLRDFLVQYFQMVDGHNQQRAQELANGLKVGKIELGGAGSRDVRKGARQ